MIDHKVNVFTKVGPDAWEPLEPGWTLVIVKDAKEEALLMAAFKGQSQLIVQTYYDCLSNKVGTYLVDHVIVSGTVPGGDSVKALIGEASSEPASEGSTPGIISHVRLATLPLPPQRHVVRTTNPRSRHRKDAVVDAYPQTEDAILDLVQFQRDYADLLREGVTPRNALRLLGFEKAAIEQVMRERPDIRREIERAEAHVPSEAEKCFGKEAMKDARTAREYLERRQPEDWKPQAKITHDVSSWSDDEIDAYIERHRQPELAQGSDGGEGSSDPEAAGEAE